MAAKKKPPQDTTWRPGLWERRYRGASIWVENMYATAPCWSWATEWDDEGRAATCDRAMRAAERAIDEALQPESVTHSTNNESKDQ